MPGTQLWLAVEGDEVRGGYILRRQTFSFGGETHQVAHYRLPLSEGLVNRAYAPLAVRLVRDALNREAELYALGMGGWEKPLPEMLKRLNWRMAAVPFYFKAPHPYRFLRQIRALRSSAFGRLACDAAAFSGAGWLALWLAGVARRTSGPAPLEAPASFAGWADAVWERCRARYAMAAVRDAATLDRLYPPSDPRFLRVRAAGGWAVLLDTAMHGHKQFGDLRVGTIVDSPRAARRRRRGGPRRGPDPGRARRGSDRFQPTTPRLVERLAQSRLSPGPHEFSDRDLSGPGRADRRPRGPRDPYEPRRWGRADSSVGTIAYPHVRLD